MGVAERRARERAEQADAALDAVERIASQEGWEAVTIRRVADAVEWSPPKLYSLFGSKAGMAAAARQRAFERLNHELAALTEPDPRSRLIAMAEHHWQFAIEDPARFQLMHGLEAAPRVPQQDGCALPAASAAFATLMDAIQKASDGQQSLEELMTNSRLLWASLFGLAALRLSGQLPPDADGRALSAQAAARAIAVGA